MMNAVIVSCDLDASVISRRTERVLGLLSAADLEVSFRNADCKD